MVIISTFSRKILLAIALLLSVNGINAEDFDFEVDGIQYSIESLSDLSVKVYKGPNVENVEIPEEVEYRDVHFNVTEIGDNAFQYASKIKNLTLPKTIKYIGDGAFSSCYKIEKIFISDLNAWFNIFFMGQAANPFYYSYNAELYLNGEKLTAIQIPDGIEKIKSFSCMGMNGCSVTIPSSTKVIDQRAFYESQVVSVYIPSSVTTIGKEAFYSCKNIKSLAIPNSVQTIGDDAFMESGIMTISLPNSISVLNTGLFFGSAITSITIPGSVLSIKNNAFSHCKDLTTVIIPNSVTSIGENVFEGCTNLSSVTIPNSVTSIGENVFRGCTNLSSVTLSNSMESIPDNTFEDCPNLTYLYIPSSIKQIGYIFGVERNSYTSDKLKQNINENRIVDVESLESWANIDFKIFPSNYPNSFIIGTQCANPLSFCKLAVQGEPVTELTIPEGVTEIKPYTFTACKGLNSLSIPSSVKAIGDGAFVYNDFSGITLPDTKMEFGDRVFCRCDNLKSTAFMNMQQTIGKRMFASCRGLSRIIIPNSISTIEDNAFQYCQNASFILISGSVNHIGEKAFTGCEAVDTIITNIVNPYVINDNCFDTSTRAFAKLLVPKGKAESYRNTTGWEFVSITEKPHDKYDSPIYLTANSYSIEYGDEIPTFDFSSEGAEVDGEPEICCNAEVGSEAGIYDIIISKGTVQNYNDHYINGTLTITKAPLVVKVEDVKREQYTENPEFVISYSGWKLNEDESVLDKKPIATTTATKDSPIGEYEIVLSGGESKNYDINYQNGILTIIESTGVCELSTEHPVDIYNMQGILVRSKATSFDGLPKGLYIVSGFTQRSPYCVKVNCGGER